jgi:predicted aspartyl protease
VSSPAFPFQSGEPVITLTLVSPDPTVDNPATLRKTFLADTGFSDYLQLDWESFTALGLQHYSLGTITSELADGSTVVDVAASVRVLISECGIDETIRCISNVAYGEDLLLAGGRLLDQCNAIIDYSTKQTAISG